MTSFYRLLLLIVRERNCKNNCKNQENSSPRRVRGVTPQRRKITNRNILDRSFHPFSGCSLCVLYLSDRLLELNPDPLSSSPKDDLVNSGRVSPRYGIQSLCSPESFISAIRQLSDGTCDTLGFEVLPNSAGLFRPDPYSPVPYV